MILAQVDAAADSRRKVLGPASLRFGELEPTEEDPQTPVTPAPSSRGAESKAPRLEPRHRAFRRDLLGARRGEGFLGARRGEAPRSPLSRKRPRELPSAFKQGPSRDAAEDVQQQFITSQAMRVRSHHKL